jgi:hypothetical protein
MAEVCGYAPTTSSSFYILAFPTLLTKTAVCIDPIIYFGFNNQVCIRPRQTDKLAHRQNDTSTNRKKYTKNYI